MRYNRAMDKETGDFVEVQDARAKKKEDRHSHDYSCLNKACDCSHHWRRAIGTHEGTENRPATFVRNRNVSHVEGCRYDYQGFARQHREVELDKDDLLNLRLQFPLSGAYADQNPGAPGALTHDQKRIARENINKRGFQDLRDLVDFIEKKMGGLDDLILEDVVLHHQGVMHGWQDLWVGANQYSKMLKRSQQRDGAERTAPVLALVKPDHLGSKTAKGRQKVVCEPQVTSENGKIIQVRPILVCPDQEMGEQMQRVADANQTVLVASRPLQPQEQRNGIKNVYMSVATNLQLARVPECYWRPVLGQDRQMALDIAS